VAASFTVALDPQVVGEVRITTARLNHKLHDAGIRLLSQTRTSSVLDTRWSTQVKLGPIDRLDLALEVRPADDQAPLGRIARHGQSHHPAADRAQLNVAERFSMYLIHGYGWFLSAVIIAGWALSWWAPRWVRWTVLCIAAVASILCIAYGFTDYGRPLDESQLHCSPFIECLNQHPVGFMTNGIVGLGCSLLLVLVTSVVELVLLACPPECGHPDTWILRSRGRGRCATPVEVSGGVPS
jgi:hypothetical protein